MKLKRFIEDEYGDAVIEAAILFPIMIMIFAALVLLAMYLPQRAILQEAAQVAAVAIATERSDTWIAFDENADRIERHNMPRPRNVYVNFFGNVFFNSTAGRAKAEDIVNSIAARGILSVNSDIDIEYRVVNYIIYQEVIINVTQEIQMPVNLSFIGFPETLTLTQEARAVVQDCDEFIRNIDIAKDMVLWLDNKFGISETLQGALGKIGEIAGR